VTTAVTEVTDRPRLLRGGLTVAILAGAVVAVSLGVYAKVHHPAGKPVFTLGFSGVLQMKAWLATIVLVLALVQLLTALAMWGKLGVHVTGPAISFAVSLPVAFHCIWSLGFATGSARVVVHGVAGCAFYGAYTAKMIGLRLDGMPKWALPVLGGTVLALVVVAWLTASLWFFTRSGVPLT
jgi:uncharacterized protein DUF6529